MDASPPERPKQMESLQKFGNKTVSGIRETLGRIWQNKRSKSIGESVAVEAANLTIPERQATEIRPPEVGMTRLYRGGPAPNVMQKVLGETDGSDEATNRWFSADLETAAWFARRARNYIRDRMEDKGIVNPNAVMNFVNEGVRITYVDVPTSELHKYLSDLKKYVQYPISELVLPEEIAQRSVPYPATISQIDQMAALIKRKPRQIPITEPNTPETDIQGSI